MVGPVELVAPMEHVVLVELVVLAFELVVVEDVGQKLLPLVLVPMEGPLELLSS